MKFTTFILIITLTQVSAKGFGQKINLNEKNTPIENVLQILRSQSGYEFFYNVKDLKGQKISVKLENASIENAIELIFKDLPLTYKIVDKNIVLTKKVPSFLERLVDRLANIDVHGRVTDSSGMPLIGAIIKLKSSKIAVVTDNNGEFNIKNVEVGSVLEITYLSYVTETIIITRDNANFIKVALKASINKLQEIVVSTGYQQVPKERATGSFTQVDNALLNRSVSTNILDRLNGVTSGLLFNTKDITNVISQSPITIRGRSTLFASADPLIVVDNFPYDGDLGNINPNDIESFTVLKDAAAASAWGTRSGNGVIVITTKKGALNTAPTIGFNANVTIGDKPDLFYSPQLSSAQYIDVEQFLYRQGAYDYAIGNGYSILSPAVEIFNATHPGGLSPADSTSRINALKGYDIRNQLDKYFYRSSNNQQYQASISGGSSAQKYFVSAGYDKNLASAVGNSYGRVTLNASNTYYLLKNKLELFSNIVYTSSKTATGQSYTFNNPYDQVADASDNPVAVANTLRLSYAQTAGNGRLLNWLYKPLDELNNNYGERNTNLTDYRINLSLSYKILEGLKASALYGYEKGISNTSTLSELGSFYTRNLINKFTQINPATGEIIYPLPLGGIYYDQLSNIQSHNGRFQVNYDKTWKKHAFSGITGVEIREFKTDEFTNQFYGYDPETASNQNAAINYKAENPYYYGSSTERLTPNNGTSGIVNRFLSYYFNGAYTYNDKYIASVSAREDESNLFGVATNQKGVPLWSAGLAWIINKENFYKASWLPQLKLRATYGYTGNVDNSLSAYLTTLTTSQFINSYNSLFSRIINPPNPSLRWEKVRNIDVGIDFSVKSNRVSGSFDFWQKSGIDLIGNSPIAPQTGIVIFTGNSANTLTKGMDLQLNSINLNGRIKWYTTFLYNHSLSKVTGYKVSNGTNFNVVSSNYTNPLQGFPYYSIFSFKYAGLNGSGAPVGYLNNQESTDYNGISNSLNRNELIYNGPATPTHFGSLRNTFIYQNFDLSFNISYRMGYYFRRNSLQNSSLYGGVYKFADYENRWQKPGDEKITDVPSLIYPANLQRDNLYTYSNSLVEKADHIRLQDIKLGYTFKSNPGIPFKNINLFTYVNNIGILWRANKYHLDPDYPTGIPPVKTIAFGLKADL